MKRLIIIAAMLLGVATAASAQVLGNQLTTDVIYTTDGLILQGTIVDQIPGVTYTIQTLDGQVYKVDALSIKRITKENVTNSSLITENYNYHYNADIPRRMDANGNPIYPLSVGGAFFRSLFIPGMGQMYNGQGLKGAALFSGVLVGVLGMTVGTNMAYGEWEDAVAYTSLALTAVCYLYSLIDAPAYAARWNKKYGFIGGDYYLNLSPSVGVVGGGCSDPAVGMSLSLSF